ncbi:DUF6994 family protein [Lactococcus lactis]|uniref:DUF6994 family protein n=1 Tax=Lactococcus lactis TaxID=1358 RepID=UPI003DA9FFEE
MLLDEYIKKEGTLSLEEFLELDVDGVIYDFLKEGIEPDRTALSKEIYQKLFPWYDDKVHSGDTLNTYRSVIMRKFFGKPYSSLDREQQGNIISVVSSNTSHFDEKIFEFDVEGKNGQFYKQICNSYKLGNFGIFPKGKINVARSKPPYNDYFDKTLEEIDLFYRGELEGDNELKRAILDEKDYFNQFEDIEDFVEKNYLNDFFDDDGYLISLSAIEEFDDYVLEVERIINLRGLRIISKLLDEDFEVLVDKFTEEESRNDEGVTENENHLKDIPKKKNHKFISAIKAILTVYGIMWEEEGFWFYLTSIIYSALFGIYPLYILIFDIILTEPTWFWRSMNFREYIFMLGITVYPTMCVLTFIFVRFFWRNHSFFDLWDSMGIFDKHYSKERKKEYDYVLHESRYDSREMVVEKRERYSSDPVDFFSNLLAIIIIILNLFWNFLIFITAPLVMFFAVKYIKREYYYYF